MINTIFYFVDTENEYQNKYRAGEIKPYTIALARDTKSIWKDGIRYGGLNQQEVDTIVNGSEDEINALIDQINNTIDEINSKVSEEKDRLDGVIRSLDGTISDKVSDMISDSQFIQQNFPQGVVTWQDGWNDKIQAYLKTVGLWDYDQDGSIVTKWSTIRQSINNITSQVNSISDGIDGHVNSLQSQITQEVNDRNEAITTISNTYANSVEDINGIQEVIEWMYSGLTSSASEDLSYAEIVAAGKNGMNSAISDLRTEIESIGDTYVAKSSLTSAVNDAISGVLNETEEGQAVSEIFSKIDANSEDIAAVVTKMTGTSSSASISSRLSGMSGSVVTTANIDTALAGLSAQGKNNVAATIFATANENGSTITLDADQINLDGQTTFDTAIGNKVDARIANANVITQSNIDGKVEAILEGGNATFNGSLSAAKGTFAGDLTAQDGHISGDLTVTGNIFCGGGTKFTSSGLSGLNFTTEINTAANKTLSKNNPLIINTYAGGRSNLTLPTDASPGQVFVIVAAVETAVVAPTGFKIGSLNDINDHSTQSLVIPGGRCAWIMYLGSISYGTNDIRKVWGVIAHSVV